MGDQGKLSQWLEERCQREHLSLRQAAAKTGLSHATIGDIIKGSRPLPETIRKLVQGFSNGSNQQIALEDKLLLLSGYRSGRSEGEDLTKPLAELMDKVKHLNELQIKIMGRFADFLTEIDRS